QTDASVAMDGSGDFIVAWSGQGAPDNSGVYMQRYGANGARLGSETLVNTTTAGTQSTPSVSVDDTGSFAIAWAGQGNGDTAGIFLKQFDSSGGTFVGETLVNTTTANTQDTPSLARDDSNRLIAIWTNSATLNLDDEVLGQLFVNDPPQIDL